ncbi:hypothetical protein GX50_02686 [[Emmonsia] crescens]|uniref:Ubiquitin 3 binding protein But2 C-terminal domain-containing protein n=1 Tax=[Emmonsia] crescens TaxID=73230 RepID=A0A2B7ZMW0_9EURO|nr:hypothetical protein GX50_02686 [Emmonsia crescens]
MFISRYLASHLAGHLALFCLLGAAIAAPAPAADLAPNKTVSLAPRARPTIPPTLIDIMDASNPHTAYLGNAFTIQRMGGTGLNNLISTFTFANIPGGATGCSLAIEFPPTQRDNQIGFGPSVTVDIWSTDPWSPYGPAYPTYYSQPRKNQLVGTINIPITRTQTPFKTIVASNTCSPTMSWLAEYSTWQQGDGAAYWYNSPGYVGFSLIFDN